VRQVGRTLENVPKTPEHGQISSSHFSWFSSHSSQKGTFRPTISLTVRHFDIEKPSCVYEKGPI